MDDAKWGVKTIQAAVVLNNFVKNEEDSNYELFLLEFLNRSNYFQGKSKYNLYQKPVKESNGECDAISIEYSIDFKLLVSPSCCKALRLTSNSIKKTTMGIAYGNARTRESQKMTWLHNLFKDKKLNDLLLIRNEEENINSEDMHDYDILNTLKTMETQKNLLLFFPFRFYTDEAIAFDKMLKIINKNLQYWFGILAEYRELFGTDFETYLLTEYDNLFLLYLFSSSGFELLEVFDDSQLPTYQKLLDYAAPLRYILLD